MPSCRKMTRATFAKIQHLNANSKEKCDNCLWHLKENNIVNASHRRCYLFIFRTKKVDIRETRRKI